MKVVTLSLKVRISWGKENRMRVPSADIFLYVFSPLFPSHLFPHPAPAAFFFFIKEKIFFLLPSFPVILFFCLYSLRSSSISPSFFLSLCTSYSPFSSSPSSLASPFFVCRRRIICEIQTDETCKTCETQETCDIIKFV